MIVIFHIRKCRYWNEKSGHNCTVQRCTGSAVRKYCWRE